MKDQPIISGGVVDIFEECWVKLINDIRNNGELTIQTLKQKRDVNLIVVDDYTLWRMIPDNGKKKRTHTIKKKDVYNTYIGQPKSKDLKEYIVPLLFHLKKYYNLNYNEKFKEVKSKDFDNKTHYSKGGGESDAHKDFKNFIASNPTKIGLSSKIGIGTTEYSLPSADTIDVVFNDNNTIIGVEVKSKISDSNDIRRGLFQCVKYKCLIEAEQKVNNKQISSKVILALEGKFPDELVEVKSILGIEVIDKIKKVT